ncbi:MAG: T9SS type A sorting domain-containing protein [Bacteroidota bacterium]
MYTPSYFNYYLGAFREDTTDRKVFFLPPDSISGTLLYDFDLNLGDTLPITYTNNDHNDINEPVTNIVTSVDSVLIGNEYHKRFEISAYNWGGNFAPYVSLIEGIGSTFGFLGWLRPDPEVPIGSTLLCFKLNGLTVFPDSNYQCDIVSSINESIKSEPIVQIFPNPFNLTTKISFNITYKTVDIELTDIQGKLINKHKCINCDEIILDRKGVENGFYFLRMTFDNKNIEIKKIIITE